MAFFTKIVWDIETMKVVSRRRSKYKGPADLLCGASKGQKQAAANEINVSDTINAQLDKVFSDNENILSGIKSDLVPITSGGPDQYGFNASEDAALRTQATDTNAAASQQTTNAVRSAEAARGGGNTYIPSGGEAEIEGALAETEAQKQADSQLGITEKGYETGRDNFFKATSDLIQAPGALEAPVTQTASVASGAASSAEQGQTDITNANNAWMAPVGGLLGSFGTAAITRSKNS